MEVGTIESYPSPLPSLILNVRTKHSVTEWIKTPPSKSCVLFGPPQCHHRKDLGNTNQSPLSFVAHVCLRVELAQNRVVVKLGAAVGMGGISYAERVFQRVKR
jgi:hypothetical protein